MGARLAAGHNLQAECRRAFLSDLKAYICLDAHESLEGQITKGLLGDAARIYGVPFLGDNNFLISKLEPVANPEPAYWFEKILSEPKGGLSKGITRLTISIDREDMYKTKSGLFAPISKPSVTIPENAWVEVGY